MYSACIDAAVARTERCQDFIADGPGGVSDIIDGLLRAEDAQRLGHVIKVGDVDGDQVHRDAADNRANLITGIEFGLWAHSADQPISIAGRNRGDQTFDVRRPGVAVTDGLERADQPRLDHGQIEAHNGGCIGKRFAAVEADTGAGQLEVILGAQQNTTRCRQRTATCNAIGHLAEDAKLLGVHRVFGLISTGQVAHHKTGSSRHQLA